MKGSWRIATFLGIPLRLHWSFSLVFLYVLYLGRGDAWDWLAMAWAIGFVLALFACVTLHEYGHAIMARQFGVPTRDIVLSPIGGIARLDRLPSKPMQELLIALAGPLVNVVIAGILGLFFFSFSAETRELLFRGLILQEHNYLLPQLSFWSYFLISLFFVNVLLALFNLLPAFPMDGGRVFRALLSLWLGRLKATFAAARLGQVFALGFIANGLVQLYNSRGSEGYVQVFIGLFVFFTARNEYRHVLMEDTLKKAQTGELMRTEFTPVYLTDPMSKILSLYDRGREKNFLVFDHWHNLVAILPEEQIQEAVRIADLNVPVSNYMRSEMLTLREDDSLATAMKWLNHSNSGALPVYNQWNNLVGILDSAGMDGFFKQGRRRRSA
ncbi:MAG: site-2 protease family protein [Haliscomenobacter sp.]|nr:site-2 protease family protein [Haliscomenobacter sp.]MBK7476817.1 site-2 protease family protein [Haliscomenobacter sp.]MBK8878710.1 site-2 protease family protein [Haliscomenobacter sp.]